MELYFHFFQFSVNGSDLLTYFFHFRNGGACVFPVLLGHGDFLGFSVFLALQGFCFFQQFSSLFVQIEHFVQIERIVTVFQICLDFVSMFSDKFDVQHDYLSSMNDLALR